ncbi:MAG: TonB-dependent siderophore receptor [Nostoc sp. DedQUE12a]|nr:TonB-dependent siderophore receptor [Nostoc sp. DedQUE12a]
MMLQKLLPILFVSGSAWVVAMNAAIAEDSQVSSSEIPYLNQVEFLRNRAYYLVQNPNVETISITGVKANPTEKGVEVILETTQGEQLQVTNRSTENNFIADIPNAQLRLPNGDAFTFRSEKPTAGITEIKVVNADANTVRVTVVGENALPTVELFDDNAGLVFGVTSAVTAMQPPETPPAGENPPSETPPEEPTAQQDEPIELVVTGEQDGYRVEQATTGTRTDTPIRDIPQSIQIVPRQVFEDQNITELGDALRNISGVVSLSNSQVVSGDSAIIRGFSAGLNANSYVNGIKQTNFGGRRRSTANIERVEVLKGPASVLFGQGEPGGIINVVTKKPLFDPLYGIEFTVGSFDLYRPTIDLTGPLNTDKTIRYRLNADYLASNSFVDFSDRQQFTVNPVVTFDISKNTTLTLEGEYSEEVATANASLPAVGTILNNPLGRVPRSRFLFYPDLPPQNREFSSIGYSLQHKFSDRWQIRNSFRASFEQVSETYNFLSFRDDNRTVDITGFRRDNADNKTYNLQTDVLGKFQTGSIKHEVLVGLEWNRLDSFDDSRAFSLPSLDLFNPNYDIGPVDFGEPNPYNFNQDSIGIYVQNLIAFSDRLKLLLGGRFDWVTSKDDFLGDTVENSESKFSPRIGIVYQPIEQISLYASYNRSFIPALFSTFNRNPDGTQFQPTTGEQFEVGIKTEFLDGRLSATLAAYQITKQNISTPDPDRPGFNIQIGEQQSQGIELDIAGQVIPGLNLIASYAYTDAKTTQDNSGFEGNLVSNVPRHSASFWATYQIQQGSLQGLGFGSGIVFVGDRPGDSANSFELPSFVRTDATIFYRRDNWRLGLNFKNLFDVYYAVSSDDASNVRVGSPFAVTGTISVQF